MYELKIIESLDALGGAIGFFPGTRLNFDTLDEAYAWAKEPIEQNSIVIINKIIDEEK